MNNEEKLDELRQLVEEAREIAELSGINGDFCCPSCRESKPVAGAFVDIYDVRICSDCYMDYGRLKLEGKVNQFEDVVPADIEH